jgi:energy-converting hydrogenase Eha subunit B
MLHAPLVGGVWCGGLPSFTGVSGSPLVTEGMNFGAVVGGIVWLVLVWLANRPAPDPN